MLVVFDIDGTLADCNHRIHHVKQKPKNWPAFDAGIKHDTLIENMAHVFWSLADRGSNIVMATGRSSRNRDATEEWLHRHNLVHYEKLYMRPDGDYRPDNFIKVEQLAQIHNDYGRMPALWFDDRPRVIRALREAGAFVVDVNQGDEEF